MTAKEKITTEFEFEKCADIFESIAYPDENMDGLMCKIHDAFGSNNTKHHNCLGCNLDSSTHQIYMFLTQKDNHTDLELSATIYILLMYLLIERIQTIFEIIGLPESYRIKYFQVFQRINKWANFIKHPKAFVLCHHPVFILENDPELNILKKESQVIIDNSFIFKYYSGDNNKKELFQELANKNDVLVIYPDFVKLTQDFCQALTKFVELIEKNEVYRDILNDKATIKDFFTEEIENRLK